MSEQTKKVLYLGPSEFRDAIQNVLGSGFEVIRVEASAEDVNGVIGEASVLFDASMKVRFTSKLLQTAKSLELVITATTGADHIDTAHLESRGIPIKTLKSEKEFLRGITPAAELSWTLLLACARRLRSAIHHVESGEWSRELFPGMMLRGRTLGIIGMGRIGGWMTRYARAFDMKVIGFDPFVSDFPEDVEKVELDELLSHADFVSIHVHFSEETKGLLGSRELDLMKEGAVLINTSRGAIVEESALLEGLKKGRPAALGVDVVEGEPDIKDSPIWQYSLEHHNVIITPHIGGFSPDALGMVLEHTARRILNHYTESHGV